MTVPVSVAHRVDDDGRGRRSVIAGRILSGLAALFLAFDAAMKVSGAAAANEATARLGFPVDALMGLGVVQIACLILYLIPRTAPLGAVLWTGYLGGAVAIHVRINDPLFSHTLFPIYVAVLLWAGLFLRSQRVRDLFIGKD